MFLLKIDNTDKLKKMQPINPKSCNDCPFHEIAAQLFKNGQIISWDELTLDPNGRIQGIVIHQCTNPHCVNIDRDFQKKEDATSLLRKILD